MAETYIPIATTTLSSPAASITFSSIPATYTDLRLIAVPTAGTASNILIQLNSDTASNYSGTWMYGNAGGAFSARGSYTYIYGSRASSVNTTPHMYTFDFFGYAGSAYKTVLCSEVADDNGSGTVSRGVNLWRSTSAISSIYIYNDSTTFATGTTATLYGIKAA